MQGPGSCLTSAPAADNCPAPLPPYQPAATASCALLSASRHIAPHLTSPCDPRPLPPAACRRAKRLRKLSRMMTSRLAQTATERFRLHTWGLLAILMIVHVVCFVVVVMQVGLAELCKQGCAAVE